MIDVRFDERRRPVADLDCRISKLDVIGIHVPVSGLFARPRESSESA
jgi:hypothetical protein